MKTNENTWDKTNPASLPNRDPQRFGFERVARVESLQIIDEMSEDAATVENFPSTPEPGSP
jgi:hypothetical protein